MAVSNLKTAMALMGVTEAALAGHLHIDRGSINRWKNSKRPFRHGSPYPGQIAEFLLAKGDPKAREALIALAAPHHPMGQSEADARRLTDEVALWLCQAAGAPEPGIAQALHSLYGLSPVQPAWPLQDAPMSGGAVGHCELDALFQHLLYAMNRDGRQLLLHICMDDGVLPIGPAFTQFWAHFTGGDGPVARVVVAQGHKQGGLNQLLSQWVPLLSRGRVELLWALDRYALRHTAFALGGEDCAYCLTQPTQLGDPLCLVLRGDRANGIARDMSAALAAGKPLLHMLTDDNLPQLEVAFWDEFAQEGPYDIFKSGINTMYLHPDDFQGLLVRRAMEPGEVQRCTQQFRTFQAMMRERMEKDEARELLSLAAIQEMVRTGRCTLPGIYFDQTGLVEMDAQAIADTCRGYARFLQQFPKMDVRLSADAPQFLSQLCWHIKYNHHVLVQTWAGDYPMSVLAENGPLISEFRRSFQAAWKREPVPSRQQLIATFLAWANQLSGT